MFPYKTYSQKYEPTQDEPMKDWKKLRRSGGDLENSMEQMFISGSSDGGNKRFYKLKQQVLQLKMQVISRGRGECSTKVGGMCAHFVDMWDLV